jgi:GNAT superfamily N-acetyltransferase
LNPGVSDECLKAPAGYEIPDGYEISTDPARLDAALNFGLYRTGSGEQAGYARVVTDYSTFGWLCDVYVDPALRGLGLGTTLAAAARDHLAQYGLRRILLATADAHGVYAKLGFEPLATPDKWMALGEQ